MFFFGNRKIESRRHLFFLGEGKLKGVLQCLLCFVAVMFVCLRHDVQYINIYLRYKIYEINAGNLSMSEILKC